MRAGFSLFTRPRLCPGCASHPGAAAVLTGNETLCIACRRELTHVTPVRPSPSVSGVPDCVAAGPYTGALRQCIVAFKDRGRPELRMQLGAMLARLADALSRGPTILVPVPASSSARRRRGYCHVTLLCKVIVAHVPRAAVASVLSSRSKPDFSGMGRAQRQEAAVTSIRVRAGRAVRVARTVTACGAAVLLVDDIVTSGATLAAAAAQLRECQLMPDAAIALAATI